MTVPALRPVGSRPMTVVDRLPSWLTTAALVALCVLVLGTTAWYATRVLGAVMAATAPLVVALLLTALVRPLTVLLQRTRLAAWLAALLTVVSTIVVMCGTVALLVSRGRSQLGDLQSAVEEGIGRLRHALAHSPLPVSEHRLEAGQHELVSAFPGLLPSPVSGAGMLVEVLGGIVLTVFLWFFLLKDGAAMWTWVVGWAPARHASRVDEAGCATWEVLSHYMWGTTAVAAADTAGIGAGMLALGVPLWASLSLIVFLGAYVPIVGAFVSGTLAVGVTLVTLGPVPALILFGVVLAVQQLEGNFLQPMILGKALHLHPVAIVLAVTVGALAGGVLGAVVAVPLVAIALRLARLARPARAQRRPGGAVGETRP
jgi:predicted PurR-regulated permease PerM